MSKKGTKQSQEERRQDCKLPDPVKKASQYTKLARTQLLDNFPMRKYLKLNACLWNDSHSGELADRLADYFEHCQDNGLPVTRAELCLAVGYSETSSLLTLARDTVDRPVCSSLIKKAMKAIEAIHERGLFKQANSGHIFALKNQRERWSDLQQVETSSQVTHTIIVTGLPKPNEYRVPVLPDPVELPNVPDGDK